MNQSELQAALQACLERFIRDNPPEGTTALPNSTHYHFHGPVNLNVLGSDVAGVTAFRLLLLKSTEHKDPAPALRSVVVEK